jgi:pilus assembly protein Flp/PilA
MRHAKSTSILGLAVINNMFSFNFVMTGPSFHVHARDERSWPATPHRAVDQLADEAGTTAIEYGLVAALIAVAIIAGISATGTSLVAVYNYWSSAISAAI